MLTVFASLCLPHSLSDVFIMINISKYYSANLSLSLFLSLVMFSSLQTNKVRGRHCHHDGRELFYLLSEECSRSLTRHQQRGIKVELGNQDKSFTFILILTQMFYFIKCILWSGLYYIILVKQLSEQ